MASNSVVGNQYVVVTSMTAWLVLSRLWRTHRKDFPARTLRPGAIQYQNLSPATSRVSLSFPVRIAVSPRLRSWLTPT